MTASLTAGAGIGLDAGSTDIIAAFFGAVLPGVDLKAAGITGDAAETLKPVLKDSIDRSLAISLNLACSATFSDEALVNYSIDLTAGDQIQTDLAIAAALKGDWTALDVLSNARVLRNAMRTTQEYKHKIPINLLGFYNALTVEDYVKSCTILRDDNGQITIVDKSKASHISVASMPYLAAPDRLQRALSESFLTTVSYAAGLGHSLRTDLSVSQSYFHYQQKAARTDMNGEIRIGEGLGLIAAGRGMAYSPQIDSFFMSLSTQQRDMIVPEH